MKRTSRLVSLLATAFFTISSNPNHLRDPYDANEYRLPESHDTHPIEAGFPIKYSGYIKLGSFWDTRQVVGVQEDQVLFYPEKQVLDANCQDINARGQFNMSPIQTRMRLDIKGPAIKHATSRAVIEYDFFGHLNISNIIRMRHAYFILEWSKVQMLAGQAYHPLYVLGADPRTLSFNTGLPMDTFARSPQFRLTYTPDPHIDLIFCASTELDTPSDGPIGFSTTYIRDAVVPRIDFQIKTYFNHHIIGAGIDYKRIRPRLKTDTGLKTRETLNTAIAIAYSALNWESVSTRTKLIFAQNPTDMTMIGGYAVSSIDQDCDQQIYTSLNVIAVWNDTQITKSKSIMPGWFIGFVKSLGARDTVLPNVVDAAGNVTQRRIFGIGTDIDYVFRFSPRLEWKVHNFLLGVELEYTRAAYGTIDSTGDVINTTPVGNTRLLVALYYYF